VLGSARQPQFLFPEGARFGADNLVLHARARRHAVADFAGPLSIKTVIRGVVAWSVGGRELVVDPASFLVLNDGERYSMDIDAPQAVETACVFFRRRFLEAQAQDATTPLEESLDEPSRTAPALGFLSRLHSDPAGSIVRRVQTLARRCSQELQPSGFEEDFLVLAGDLLLLYEEVRSRMERVRAVKSGTREELFRRLEKGREYLHGSASEPVSLEQVARAACLSRYHFHRAFARAYRKTPHSYLTGVRLTRAHGLLRAGQPVIEACQAVGFTSTSSFSRLFRGVYGVPPSQIRKIGQARGAGRG
jgi:AraC-like DNA-binding protein